MKNERGFINPFTTMWSTGGPRYTLRRNCIEKHFLLLLFFGWTLNIVCHQHCLWYSLSPLFHSMMLLVKVFKTKKCITVRTEGFYFLCCRIAYFCSLLFSVFFHNSQHSVFGHRDQNLPFLRADDPQICVSFGLLNVSWTRSYILEWHTKK